MHGLDVRLAQWSGWFGLPTNVLAVLAATLGVLAFGSMVRLATHLTHRSDESAARLRSLGAWWGIVLAWTVAVLIGRFGVIVLMAAVSAVALREYIGLVVPCRAGGRRSSWRMRRFRCSTAASRSSAPVWRW